MWRVADRAHHGRSRDDRAIVELDPVGFDPCEPPFEDQLDACARQLLRGMAAEAFPELGQDVCAAVDEDDIRLREARESPPSRMQKVDELCRDLDACRSPTDHDEREERSLPLGIGFVRGLFEHRQCVVAEVERVAQAPDAQCVLGHARHGPEIGDASKCDDQRVIADSERRSADAPSDVDLARHRVDRLDVPDLHIGAREHPPERDHDVGGLDRAGDDVGKERLEHEIVVLVDQGHRRARM